MIGFTKPILDTEIATISDGKDITRGYVTALAGWLETQDEILRRGGGDLKIYEQVRRDDQVQACLEQRILAHSSQEWEVIPASNSKADRAAADFIREQVAGIPWDRISQKMHLAVFYGHKEAEAIYTRDGKNVVLDDTRGGLRVKDARRFRYDEDGNLRLLTFQDWQGEIMPPKKFWTLSYGNTHDDDHYGIGLAYWLYYPCLFKRGGLRSWLQYLDKFAQPTVVGKYPAGTDKEGRDTLKAAVRAFASQTGVMIPEGMMLELAEASRSGTADYSQLVGVMNEAISKIIVGQTMTTDDGSSEAQANVHMDVRQDLVKSDADLINESANGQWVRWLTEWNFPDAKPPKLWRKIDVEEDLNARVNRDKTLFDLGWQLTAERFAEVYGDGYEQKPQGSGQAGLQGVLAAGSSPQASFESLPPDGVSFEEFIESLEVQFQSVEFAQKQCKKGYPCGGSCISRSKICKKVLTGQAATYGEWLKNQAQATGVASGGTTAASAKPVRAERTAQDPKPKTARPDSSPDLFKDHVLGTDARITTDALDRALRSLESDENKENLDKFRRFINEKGVRAVFHVPGSSPSRAELKAIAKQVGSPIRDVEVPRPNVLGYTNRFFNHVVLASHDPQKASFNPSASDLIKTNIREVLNAPVGRQFGTFSENSESSSDEALIVYLHEMGHQLHYSAGLPRVDENVLLLRASTLYASTNDREYAAEHFIPWAITPEAFRKADPSGYDFVDKMVQKALGAARANKKNRRKNEEAANNDD